MESPAEHEAAPVWRFSWLTPGRCRLILLIVIALGFLSHLHYLTDHCPIDLAGDEAHYWDWSRQLDWCYYSKGPLVAWIIRASTEVFGSAMWAVRLPAMVLGVGTTILTYWLTLKLFGSEKLALGAVLLYHLVPVFVAGSVLMTIDPPFFFCWALATCLLAKALMDEVRWAWILAGIVVGVGLLAKYAMPLWFVSMGAAIVAVPEWRKYLKTPWPWVAMAVSLPFWTPVIVWNARHGWVSLHHVARQTGTSDGSFSIWNPLAFLGGQFAVIGPAVAVMMIGAIVVTWRTKNRGAVFLLAIGGPFFAVVAVDSLVSKIQVNWPAPAYFTLMILTAWFISTRLQSRELWRPWRWWFYGGLVAGIILMPLAHDTSITYPAANWIDTHIAYFRDHPKRQIHASEFDPTARLRGRAEIGEHLGDVLETMPRGTFILCDDYQRAAEAAFYTPGQPKTYYAGSYFADANKRKRYTQYDLWPDRSLEPEKTQLLGRDAIYVGWMMPDVRESFARVERMPDVEIMRRGAVVATLRWWKCSGFKGMNRPRDGGEY